MRERIQIKCYGHKMIENIDNPTMAQKWSALHMACETAEMIAGMLDGVLTDETVVEVEKLDLEKRELIKSAFPFVSIRKVY